MYFFATFMPIIIGTIILIVLLTTIFSAGYTVRQQHIALIERLGRFSGFAGPGFHLKIPFVDAAYDIDLKTEDEHVVLDAKTSDNVTIELEVSMQYHVDTTNMDGGKESGVYKSYYTLQDPVAQMRDYLADALRSQIPTRTLEAVFTEKDEIAKSVDDVVSAKMLGYGYVLVTTLITRIRLPKDVEESMNRITTSKNNLESATNDANAAKAKTVIAAQAKAEAMEAEGRGIANQRIAIATGIKESIDTIRTAEMSSDEANRLFEYTQWIDMMTRFAEGSASTVVLPNSFEGSSTFDQVLAAQKTTEARK